MTSGLEDRLLTFAVSLLVGGLPFTSPPASWLTLETTATRF